ncbi:MAG: photosynthetic complex putative assembly protein PuhB [Rhizomicrobium sp.]
MSGHDDYAIEPMRGLPEALPPDETILWQDAPDAWEIAKHVFHVRLVALYLLALTGWRFSVHLLAGNLREAVVATLSLLTISLFALSLLALLAWLCSRTSVYTITSRRIVMRIGVALPTAINIPFAAIGAAGLRAEMNGSGDISLALNCEERLAWSNFWPHVRPWRLARPQPMLRGIANVHAVADILAAALARAMPDGTVRTARPETGRAHRAPGATLASGQTA